MTAFLDSSALLKRYATEEGSEAVNRIVDSGEDLYVSELSAVEVISAFARRVRTDEISMQEFEDLKTTYLYDLIYGRYFVVGFEQEDKGRAQGILSTYGMEREAKTLDCLIFSAVERTIARNPGAVLLSCDRRLLNMAGHFQINASNPTVL